MKCKNCSAEIDDSALFCAMCGEKQADDRIEMQINAIERKLAITQNVFSDKGRISCAQWIKEFGVEEVLESIEIAIKQYLRFDDNSKPVKSSVDEVFEKIPGICANRKRAKEKPYIADSQKMLNYALKKFYLSEQQKHEYKEYIERVLYLYSKNSDYIEKFEELFWQLKKADDKWFFFDLLAELAE